MTHSLIFAGKMLDLFEERNNVEPLLQHELNFLQELNLGRYIESYDGIKRLNDAYYRETDALIDDLAFISNYVEDGVDIETLSQFIDIVATSVTNKRAKLGVQNTQRFMVESILSKINS